MIKSRLGKLDVGEPRLWWSDTLDALQLTPLPFRPEHVDEIRDLGAHHGDPFDRALIAVAIAEELSLLTADKGIKASTQSHEPKSHVVATPAAAGGR